MSNAAPGWYPQPDGTQRYWDGKGWTEHTAPAPTEPVEKKTGGSGCIWVIVAAIALGGILWWLSGLGSKPSVSNESTAWSLCKTKMSGRLKAPATAGYPMLSELNWTKSGSTYTFPAWVDAENSFGAQIRTRFTCTATDTHDGMFTVSVS